MTHHVAWTLDDHGTHAKFECFYPSDAECRIDGECQPLLFFSESMPEETYNGPEGVAVMDGPIDVEWHGDHYTWHYGDKYAGPHGVCYMSLESKAKQFRAALSDLRHTISANAEVGHEIRLLLLPGIKRKTYRREELQSIVDAADGSRA